MSIKMTTPYGTLEFDTPDEAAAYTSALTEPTKQPVPEPPQQTIPEPEPAPVTEITEFRRKNTPKPQVPVTPREVEAIELLRNLPEAQPEGDGVKSADVAYALEWSHEKASSTLNKLNHDRRGVERIEGHLRYRLTAVGKTADLILNRRPQLFMRREEA